MSHGPEPVETDPATTDGFEWLEDRPDDEPENLPGGEPENWPPADPIELRLLTTEQILNLPPPDWLIDNYLVKNSLAVLYGPSGCGKTFLALDWALHVATGSYWHDNRVDGGVVLYIAAEGVAGIGKRVKAWMEHNHVDDLGEHHAIHWLPDPVNVATDAVGSLIRVAKKLKPSLIVFDTLARLIVGADENSAKDMGEVVAHLDWLRKATSATVLLVHHTGKDVSAGARGSSALLGAVDTALEVAGGVAPTDPQMTVRVKKQKDAAAADPMRLTRVEVAESCVLVPTSSVAGNGGRSTGADAALKALKALRDVYTPRGVTAGEWETSAKSVGLSRATFYRCRSQLVKAGLVKDIGTAHRPLYVPVDKEERQ